MHVHPHKFLTYCVSLCLSSFLSLHQRPASSLTPCRYRMVKALPHPSDGDALLPRSFFPVNTTVADLINPIHIYLNRACPLVTRDALRGLPFDLLAHYYICAHFSKGLKVYWYIDPELLK